MSNEKIDWDKVTIGPVEGEKAAEVVDGSNPVEGQESIQGQIEQQEIKLQANMARLQENVEQLPNEVEIRDEGIRAKFAEFKEMIQRNREDVMTKLGSGLGIVGLAGDALIGGLVKYAGSASAIADLEQGAAYFTGMAAAGVVAIAIDQVMKKVGAYLEGRTYEKSLKEQTA